MIISSFDNKTEAVINPTMVAPPIDGFPKIAIVGFGDYYANILLDNYESEKIGSMYACMRFPIYKVDYKDKQIAMYCSGLGGSLSAGLLEEMISKGCEKFVFFGSCGVLNKEIAAKSLIIPTSAYRDEGTSYHYAPPSDFIDVPTAAKLAAVFQELGLSHICGKTWTTDAFYRETRGNIEKRRQDGCITVEMECASIMAVGNFRGVEIYQYLYAADSLDGIEWDSRTLGGLPQDAREGFLKIALEIAVRV